jgi:RimJ/RimL family protein N-acetyltransferase
MWLASGDVLLRGFEPALSDALYAVRNHPSVRRHMRAPDPISRDSHARWVEENLLAERRVHLFLVFSGGAAVGITLLRNFSGPSAEIGVMVVDAPRRRLVSYKAAHLIGYYGFEVLGLQRLVSLVPRHNAHALAFNVACGFERTFADPPPYFELALTREVSRTHPVHRRFRQRFPIASG